MAAPKGAHVMTSNSFLFGLEWLKKHVNPLDCVLTCWGSNPRSITPYIYITRRAWFEQDKHGGFNKSFKSPVKVKIDT